MLLRLAVLIALGLAIPAAAANRTFDYAMKALVYSDLRTTEWIATRWSATDHVNCTGTCLGQSACAIHVLPPDHKFAETLNYDISVRDGYTVAKPTSQYVYDMDFGPMFTLHCPVGVYRNGATFAFTMDGKRTEVPIPGNVIGFVVRQDSGLRDVLRWWVSIDALKGEKNAVVRPADAPDVRSGTATLQSEELLALASHVKRVDTFGAPKGLETSYPLCVNPSAYAPADEPICLAKSEPARVDWSVTTSAPTVVASMMAAPSLPDGSCDIANSPGDGPQLCASMTNIGLTVPPVVAFRVYGEGTERDSGLPVARKGEDVCFRPSVFSFDSLGTDPLRWLKGDGVSSFTPVADGKGNFCTRELPLGPNTVYLHAEDPNGKASANRALANTRGPVVLVHGYGPGSPANFDDIGPALAGKGFQERRIDLRRQVNFNSIIPVPFYFNPKKVDLSDGGNTVSKLVTEARTNIAWNAMQPLYTFELPIPEKIAAIAKVLQFLGLIPSEKNIGRTEIASVKGVCVDGVCAGAAFDAAFQLRTSGTSPTFAGVLFANLQVSLPPETPLNQPLAGELPLDWTYEGIGIAGIGLRYRVVFEDDQTGTGYFMPYVRFRAPMFGLRLANGDLRGYERDLNAFVDETLASTGYRRLDIVGYSMGGLLAHSWANNKTMTGHVGKIVALGAPGRGSETAFVGVKLTKMLISKLGSLLGPLGQIVVYVGESIVDEIVGPALPQMYPHSDFVRQAHRSYATGDGADSPRSTDLVATDVLRFNYVGVDYLGGAWGPTLCHVHIPFVPISDPLMNFPNTDDFIAPWLCNGDGIVTEDSASVWTHPWVTQRRVEGFHVGIQNKVGAERIACDLDPALCGATAVAVATTARGSGTAVAAPSALAQASTYVTTLSAVAPAAEAPHVPRAYETTQRDPLLAPGETLAFTVDADPTASSLIVTLGGPPASAAALDVESPGGAPIDVMSTPVGPAVVLNSPSPGTYTIRVSLPPAATSSEQLSVTASVATDAFLALRATGPTRTESGTDRAAGEPVLLSGLFLEGARPFVHAGVSCVVRTPDGSDHSLDLVDDGGHIDGVAGDGLFSATAPGEWFTGEGSYLVECVALGNTPKAAVERRAALAIRVRGVDEVGIVADTLAVEPASVGNAATVQFELYNLGARPRDIVTVELSEKLDAGESRRIGCTSVAPLPPGTTTPAAVTWTPREAGCRTLQAAVVGVAGMPRDASASDPRRGMRRTLRACVAGVEPALVAHAGDGYSYQEGARRVVLDGSRSLNTTDRTVFAWTVRDASDPTASPIATAAGRVVAVDVPRVAAATVTLTLTDPARGSAVASASLTDRSRVSASRPNAPFQDWVPPVAAISGPATAMAGEPVTFQSASTDNFGHLPVQLWRLHGVDGTGPDAVGASVTTIYRRPGTYTVELWVRDAAGFSAAATRTVQVTAQAPTIQQVAMPTVLQAGMEAVAWVVLGGSDPAGEQVQLSLGRVAPDGTFVRTAGSASPADACGVARIPVTPLGRIAGDEHVLVEVLGHATCDPATSSCAGGVTVVDPGGPRRRVDTTPPSFIDLSPAGARDLDPCRQLKVRFQATDEGSGVDSSSVGAALDGVPLRLSGDCVTQPCAATIDTATLSPGAHVLLFTARDLSGNLAQRDLTLRLEASIAALQCRLAAGICAGIPPDGTLRAIQAHLDAARRHEAQGALRPAANELAALIHFGTAQRGIHIPAACADGLIDEAEATIRRRWGLDLAQLP